jgi:cell division protein FtsI/penicillin-binding protein 2
VLATPLQLAVLTARVANGGLMVRPRLTRKHLQRRAKPVGDPGFRDRNRSEIDRPGARGMFEVVNNPAAPRTAPPRRRRRAHGGQDRTSQYGGSP